VLPDLQFGHRRGNGSETPNILSRSWRRRQPRLQSMLSTCSPVGIPAVMARDGNQAWMLCSNPMAATGNSRLDDARPQWRGCLPRRACRRREPYVYILLLTARADLRIWWKHGSRR